MKKKFFISIGICIVILVGVAGYFLFHQPTNPIIKLPLPLQIGQQTSGPNHIVIITMENKAYTDIVGSPHAPYINSLITTYSFADNFFAVAHPSLPNYLAMIGGSTFGVTSDCNDCFVNKPSLITQLEQMHKTWKAYMESMPSSCYVGNDGDYAQKHNPFIYFDDIRKNSTRCSNIVPYSQVQHDLLSTNTTPNFIWISPNLCSDMHDCSVETGDTWLASNVPLILQSPAFSKEKSLLIITWDEGEKSSNNHVPTLFIGNTVKKHFISHTPYTHYSLLHTIENLWELPPLTKNVTLSPIITDIFQK